MNKANKFFILLLILFVASIYPAISQNGTYNGTYKCTAQSYNDESNPSKDAIHNYLTYITIYLDDVLGGTILINYTDDNFIYQYNVIRKADFQFFREDNTLYIQYDAKFTLFNITALGFVDLILINDLKNNQLGLSITNKGSKTMNSYYNLVKLK